MLQLLGHKGSIDGMSTATARQSLLHVVMSLGGIPTLRSAFPPECGLSRCAEGKAHAYTFYPRAGKVENKYAILPTHFAQSKMEEICASCFPARPVKKGFKVYQRHAKEYLLTDTTGSKRWCLLIARATWERAKLRLYHQQLAKEEMQALQCSAFSNLHSPSHSCHSACSCLPHPPSLLPCIGTHCAEVYLHLNCYTHSGSKCT